MKKHLVTLAALLAATSGLGLGAAGLAAADTGSGATATGAVGAVSTGNTARGPAQFHPKTIVEVTGDAANGFTIERLDGTFLFPPTDSEAFAECGEYDTRVAVVRCRTEVRVWYRELAQLQRSLAYVRAQAG